MTLSEQNDERPNPASSGEPDERGRPDAPADLAGAARRRAACRGGAPYRAVGVLDRGRYLRVQALEDAIGFRAARAAAPCQDCDVATGRRCDDHAGDLAMIAWYRAAIQRSNLILGPPPPPPDWPPSDAGPSAFADPEQDVPSASAWEESAADAAQRGVDRRGAAQPG
jgi:hypothetical protein